MHESKEWNDSAKLDFAWWASNGPTAGHLFHIAIRAVQGAGLLRASSPSTIDLRILGSATPGNVELECTYLPPLPYGNDGVAMISFIQGEPVALARVEITSPRDGPNPLGARPPTVMSAHNYPRMHQMEVPVTRNFFFRPTWQAKPALKPGWDVVWIEGGTDHAQQREFVASVVDAWYPGYFLRVVHDYLRGSSTFLQESQPARLLGGRLIFTAPDDEYAHLERVLLVSRLDATVNGRHLEQAEIWSERRVLLATVRMERLSYPS